MKKILIVLPFVILILFSCKSTPKSGEEIVDLATAKGRAVAAMEKAKSIKADVALKDEYNNALNVFDDAEKTAQTSKDEPVLIAKYLEAEKLFLNSYEGTRAKRDEAQRQLNKAKEDIKRVENEADAFENEKSGGPTR